MCPTPVPPQPGQRPAPPPPTGSRPAPPPPTGRPPAPPAPTIGGDVMAFLTRKVDRDDNNVIEDNEARVAGRVGNRNGVNGTAETARALNAGEAMLYGFQLARDAAEAIARKLAGSDPWVSREDFEISADARRRLDQNDDNRVSADELADGLQRGGLAMNGKELATTDEAKARFSRPTPPPPGGDRPTPPSPGGDRPTPPSPGVDRPRPPRPDGDRPTPPPVFTRTPAEVADRFLAAHAELKRVYDTTSMSRADYESGARRQLAQATDELLTQTAGAPFAQRKAALQRIYDGSPMSQTERTDVEKKLLASAVADLLAKRAPFAQAREELKALYDGSGMSQTERGAVERQLIDREIERIVFGSFPSYAARQQALQALYDGSSMSASERSEVGRRIDAEEARRVTRY